jgi:hypothetical protein
MANGREAVGQASESKVLRSPGALLPGPRLVSPITPAGGVCSASRTWCQKGQYRPLRTCS